MTRVVQSFTAEGLVDLDEREIIFASALTCARQRSRRPTPLGILSQFDED